MVSSFRLCSTWLLCLAACGGGDSRTCGAGTVASGDQCVAASAGATGGVGGAATGGTGPGVGGSGTGIGGGGVGAGGAGTGGGPPDGTDPCPVAASQSDGIVDCSGECGTNPACTMADTCFRYQGEADFSIGPGYKLTFRTVDHPGTNAACVGTCTSGNTVYAHSIKLGTSGGGTPGAPTKYVTVRASVSPPWKIAYSKSPDFADACIHATTKSCATNGVAIPGSVTVLVVTDDPNAPSRNVIVEGTSNPCP